MKKVALHNLGCKVNAYETEAMQQMLEQNNYEIVPFAKGADIYIINTCTVTNIADRKSRQMLHKAKKLNPEAIVVAVGCYVQAAKDDLEIDDRIDLIIGNNKKKDLIKILQDYQENSSCNESLLDINQENEYEELTLKGTALHTRAYIKVQDGCNQFCSYCIIPYARGRVRSRKVNDVIEEVARLGKNGYQEIVLTGIHLSSYGIDSKSGDNLLTLIEKIHEVESIKRIRLGSLEPRIVTEEFASTIEKLPKVCAHFHLSLQSGCDETLKRMNRRYVTGEYYEKCELLREHFKNPAITTDVIVGFPGETEEEFQITKEFIKKVDFYETHIFKYSKRQGTKAAQMENQIDDRVKTKRSTVLLEITKKNSKKYRNRYIEKEVEILIEESIQIEGIEYQTGYTKDYIKVAVKNSENLINKIVTGKVTGFLKDEILLANITKV